MNPMLASFDRYEDAAAAHAELLAAGLAASAVQLHIVDDDGGPVEGNFVCGNGRKPGVPDVVGLPALEPPLYEENFANPVARGAHLLVVEPADEAQRREVALVVARYGAVDVGARQSAGG
jgi:hypothetical protein